MKTKSTIPKAWAVKSFKEIFEFKNGINADKSSYGVGVKFINVMEIIYNDLITEDKIPGSVQINDTQKLIYSVKTGDVLFNRTSETTDEVGLSAVFQGSGDVVFGGFVIRGRCKGNDIDNDFKKYCFRSSFIRKQIILRGQGAVRSNIGQADLETVEIILPPIEEQKKIALILSKWDEAIELYTRLIRKKEAFRKELMQQLLTQELSFPEFGRSWKFMNLSDISDVIMGQSPTSNSYNFERKGIPLIQGNTDMNHRKTNPRVWTIQPTKTIEEGSIVMTVRAPVGAVGIATIKCCIGRGICGVINHKIDSGFLFWSLVNFESRWGEFEQGSTFTAVNSSDVRNIKLKIPVEKREQEKIARLLNTCETEIQESQDALKLVFEQKKALMENLLTGKIRVKKQKYEF